jgi:hypothetical protein
MPQPAMTALLSYRHVQPYTLLWIVLPLTMLVMPAADLARGGDEWPRAAAPVAVMIVGALLLLFLGRLVVEIRGETLSWRFGFVGWPRWRVALDDIVAVERTRASGWHGSGIKGPRRNRLYNVTIGGPAVRITLGADRTVTLGTPEPDRLAAYLEARLPRRR